MNAVHCGQAKQQGQGPSPARHGLGHGRASAGLISVPSWEQCHPLPPATWGQEPPHLCIGSSWRDGEEDDGFAPWGQGRVCAGCCGRAGFGRWLLVVRTHFFSFWCCCSLVPSSEPGRKGVWGLQGCVAAQWEPGPGAGNEPGLPWVGFGAWASVLWSLRFPPSASQVRALVPFSSDGFIFK